MRRFLLIVTFLIFYVLFLRLPVLKTKVQGNNFYYRDLLGFIYTRHSSCGWIGPCSHWDVPLLGIHSFTFKTLKYSGLDCLDAYAKSNTALYYLGEKQHQVKSPATFELMNNMYAKDSANVYKLCELEVLNIAEPDRFITVGPVCSKSTTSVYCFQKEVENADINSFEHVWRGYYKDKNKIYFLGKPLGEIDPDTFELLSWGYLKDKNAIFFLDENAKELTELKSADKTTFKVLTEMYAVDASHVFKSGIVLSHTNPKIFKVPQ